MLFKLILFNSLTILQFYVIAARTTEPEEQNEVVLGVLTGRALQRTQNNMAMYFWCIFTLMGFMGDFAVALIYYNDLRHASDLVSLVKFIRGRLTGAGLANPDTHIVVWTMTMIVSKCGLGFILNLFLAVITMLYCSNEYTPSIINTPSSTESDSSMNQEMEMRERFPPPLVPVRRGPRFVKRTPEQNRALLNLHHPDIYPAQEIPPPEITSPEITSPETTTMAITSPEIPTPNILVNELPHPGTGKYSVKFPESLMSITQRIEKILKHEHVSSPIPAGMTKKTTHKPTISPVMSMSSGEDEHVVQMEEVLPSRKAKQLNSQMPWSYIPPLVNHMRDQLPDDEELPPVPVPDYIVHPSYRKASVHRAQSSLSRELQTKLTMMQNQNKSLKEKHKASLKALRVYRNRISA